MARMAEEQTGGMIALIPSDTETLRVSGGDKAEELHLTVVYLGDDVTEWSADRRNHVTMTATQAALSVGGPVHARIMGHAVFNPDGEKPCAVYLVGDSAMLAPLHEILREVAHEDQHAPFIPHVTAGWGIPVNRLKYTGPVVFDRMRVAFAGQVYDYPLGEVTEKSVASDFLVFDMESKRMSMDPNAVKLREYWARGEGRAKWDTFRALRNKLRKYVTNPHILDGLTANIYTMAKGRHPGRKREGKAVRLTLTETEMKAALALADPDAEYDENALADWFDNDGDGEPDEVDEDDPEAVYEQALVDEVDWEINAGAELVREDDDEDDEDPPGEVAGPRTPSSMGGVSLFDF